jgi:hypothetical protein
MNRRYSGKTVKDESFAPFIVPFPPATGTAPGLALICGSGFPAAMSIDCGWKAAPTGTVAFQPKYILCPIVQLLDELLRSQCNRYAFSPTPWTPTAGAALGSLFPAVLPDSFQQLRRGFVGGVLGDELPAEGLGEDGLGQPVDVGFGFLAARFDVVGDGSLRKRAGTRNLFPLNLNTESNQHRERTVALDLCAPSAHTFW